MVQQARPCSAQGGATARTARRAQTARRAHRPHARRRSGQQQRPHSTVCTRGGTRRGTPQRRAQQAEHPQPLPSSAATAAQPAGPHTHEPARTPPPSRTVEVGGTWSRRRGAPPGPTRGRAASRTPTFTRAGTLTGSARLAAPPGSAPAHGPAATAAAGHIFARRARPLAGLVGAEPPPARAWLESEPGGLGPTQTRGRARAQATYQARERAPGRRTRAQDAGARPRRP